MKKEKINDIKETIIKANSYIEDIISDLKDKRDSCPSDLHNIIVNLEKMYESKKVFENINFYVQNMETAN